tara:strand:- start:710 stop:1873 length:1164 start_codon:yes stop_codon:yes gene_type:complete
MTELDTIQLKRSFNFKDIEKLIRKTLNSENSKLQIPNTFSYSGGFGMEGAALQLFSTWLRHSSNHTIHTAVKDTDNSEQFNDLCNKLFGLTCLRLSDTIWSNSKQEIALPTALKPAIGSFDRIRREDFKNAFKGMYLTIPAIKSSTYGGKNREFDSPLYNEESVVGSKKFLDITEKSIDAIAPGIRVRLDNDKVINHLSEILRELFTNTHRHARSDVHGNPYSKNFRAIIFNSINLTTERLDEISKSGGAKLTLFIGDWKPKGSEQFRAIDITIVDSGPGYARRWSKLDKDDLNIDIEKAAIVECFKKHRSSDITDSSGSGLSNVLNDLKALRGWFRLRTGRTLVEKSFFDNSGSDKISIEDIKEMNDFAEGVVFNVVIPLKSFSRT